MQVKKTCYAQTSQIRLIRKKMVEIMAREASSCDLKELVGKFIPESIGAAAAAFAGSPGHAVYLSPQFHPVFATSFRSVSTCRSCSSMPIVSMVCAGKDIEKACQGIYPLQNTYIRKVKVLRAPKFDVNKVSQQPCYAVLSPLASALCKCFISLLKVGRHMVDFASAALGSASRVHLEPVLIVMCLWCS